MQWSTRGCRACDVLLSKVRDGEKEEYSCRDAEVEEEIAYGFICNCKNTEQDGEGRKEEESSNEKKRECLNVQPAELERTCLPKFFHLRIRSDKKARFHSSVVNYAFELNLRRLEKT